MANKDDDLIMVPRKDWETLIANSKAFDEWAKFVDDINKRLLKLETRHKPKWWPL